MALLFLLLAPCAAGLAVAGAHQTIDRNGTVRQRAFDADPRLEAIRTTVQAWEYDGLSRPRVCVDQNDPLDPSDDVATSYTYDSLSRPLTERHRFRAQTTVNAVNTQFGRITVGATGSTIDRTVGRTFDLDSNRETTTYSSGRVIRYEHDGADRVQQIIDQTLGQTIQTTEWIGGRPLVQDAGNGVHTAFGYETQKPRLQSLGYSKAGVTVANFSYSWTRSDQRATETFSATGLTGETRTFSYDSAARLVGAAFQATGAPAPYRVDSWLIDGVGNQAKKVEDGQTTALNVRANGRYMADAMNEVARLTRFSATGLFVSEDAHTNDPNGNRLKDKDLKLTWDAFDRLVKVVRVSSGQTVAIYKYDASSRRVDRQFSVGGGPLTQVYHVHDGAQEIEELDASGAVRADFVWGGLYLDQIVQLRRGGNTYYLHQNSIFSVVAATDASGNVSERYGYSSVYGVCVVSNADGTARPAASEIGQPWRFQGRRYDPETGFYYFRMRYLDASAGRWVNRDPLGIWGDAGQLGNAYSAFGNDPVNGLDPWGLQDIGWNDTPYPGTEGFALAAEGLKRAIDDLASALDSGKYNCNERQALWAARERLKTQEWYFRYLAYGRPEGHGMDQDLVGQAGVTVVAGAGIVATAGMTVRQIVYGEVMPMILAAAYYIFHRFEGQKGDDNLTGIRQLTGEEKTKMTEAIALIHGAGERWHDAAAFLTTALSNNRIMAADSPSGSDATTVGNDSDAYIYLRPGEFNLTAKQLAATLVHETYHATNMLDDPEDVGGKGPAYDSESAFVNDLQSVGSAGR